MSTLRTLTYSDSACTKPKINYDNETMSTSSCISVTMEDIIPGFNTISMQSSVMKVPSYPTANNGILMT